MLMPNMLSSRRLILSIRSTRSSCPRFSSSETATEAKDKESPVPFADDEEFRVLNTVWPPPKPEGRRGVREGFLVPNWKRNIPRPRYERMATDQDWKSVWPTAKMFNPAVVPLPIHMGYVKRPDRYAAPNKWANLELMKIPNFLHLAPPAIKAHCQVLKKFCTPWPKELTDDEECFKHFPLEFVFSDYVHAAPTIRDVRARVVKLTFKLSALPLNYHARDKMIRILNGKEKRYNEETDIVTIVADRCPLKIQNYDYINYLLTACFFEAWKSEEWEEEKERSDWERYYFDKSPCFHSLVKYLEKVEGSQNLDPEHVLSRKEVQAYGDAVSKLFDEKVENEELIDSYKKSVMNLLFPSDGSPVEGNSGQKDDPSPDQS